MGKALYRKYRSRSLSEIIGQEHITETLRRAIDSGRISHAYLFTGPRGVGKTSIARILAHELNKVPYSDEKSHLDIIEIDAASNGGVEEIRELRDRVHVAPSSGKYKVYIIDEVHMMTTSAFNALLKTLEEPPEHVIFILATTEAHKLPATIISRTQRFIFRPVAKEKIAGHLKHIAELENIDISEDALTLIALHSEGSFRDSISMLDQAGSLGRRIEQVDIERLLGLPGSEQTQGLLRNIASGDVPNTVTQLSSLRERGFQSAAVAKLLVRQLRQLLIDGDATLLPISNMINLASRLLEVSASRQSDQLLELIAIEAALGTASQSTGTAAVAHEQPKAATTKQTELPQRMQTVSVTFSAGQHPVQDTIQPVKQTNSIVAASATTGSILDDAKWQLVLAALRQQYNTLYGIIRMAKPEFLPDRVKLTFGFAFHQKRANDAKNKQLLLAVIENVSGQRTSVECLFDKNVTPPAPSQPAIASVVHSPQPTALDAISNIFGGGEVLNG